MEVRLGGNEAVIRDLFSVIDEGLLAYDIVIIPESLRTIVSTLDILIDKVYDDADCMDDPLYLIK